MVKLKGSELGGCKWEVNVKMESNGTVGGCEINQSGREWRHFELL